VPAISLPLFEAGGLPVGVQLMGFANEDARLLARAAWLLEATSSGICR
jgi:Asp-tRNA(Asn)/Glu-tRNA(Gln) amidotransferase A subunit family amidase